jgi:tRNA-modifying protein YgfZ
MTSPVSSTPLFKLNPQALTQEMADALRHGALFARAEVRVVDLVGPGVVACFQGLLTNDIEEPGNGAFVYGALLTTKGMILTDGWAARLESSISYALPVEGRVPALEIFQHSLPPRLARFTDRSEDVAVVRLIGPKALAVAASAGFPVPTHPSRVAMADDASGATVARAADLAPFAVQITCPTHQLPKLRERLTAAGALSTKPSALELARILAGWPRLGAEIDAKTLPQEVRLDELGGVSYTKGCYVGQETVARVHFRGHPNRALRGLRLDGEPDASGDVTAEATRVGRLTSAARLPADDAWIGLAVLRREIDVGAELVAGGRAAVVVALPFSA